jgi:hypothetical protein
MMHDGIVLIYCVNRILSATDVTVNLNHICLTTWLLLSLSLE